MPLSLHSALLRMLFWLSLSMSAVSRLVGDQSGCFGRHGIHSTDSGCARACVCVCVRAWRDYKSTLDVIPLAFSPLIFGTGPLTGLQLIEEASQQDPEISKFHIFTAEIISMCCSV